MDKCADQLAQIIVQDTQSGSLVNIHLSDLSINVKSAHYYPDCGVLNCYCIEGKKWHLSTSAIKAIST